MRKVNVNELLFYAMMLLIVSVFLLNAACGNRPSQAGQIQHDNVTR